MAGLIHKTHFKGSPRKLKGRKFGKWVRINGKTIWVRERKR